MSRLSCLSLAVASTFSPMVLAAPDGFPDQTFGLGGLQTVAFDHGFSNWDRAKGIVALPDGRIILAGTVESHPDLSGIGLARLSADGQIDESFGQWYLPNGLSYVQVADAVLQPDGKLVVAGHNIMPLQGLVCRFLPNGSIDTGFATLNNPLTSGCRTLSIGENSAFTAAAVQRNGRIALAGWSGVGLSPDHGLTVRLDAQGNFDPSFDGDGVRILLPESSNPTWLNDIAETPDGDLVAVGTATINGNNDNWQVFRLRGEDGSPDTQFDVDGLKPIAIDHAVNGDDVAAAVSVLPNGRMVIGGTATGPTGRCPTIARLLENGQFDNSLDGDGVFFEPDLCPAGLNINDMLVQSNGRIVLAGDWSGNFIATRMLSQGGLDPSFGVSGVSPLDFDDHFGVAQSADTAFRIASHAGRILLVGSADPGGVGRHDFAIARLDNDLIFADDLE